MPAPAPCTSLLLSTVAVSVLVACTQPPSIEQLPCYERHTAIPVDQVTSLGLAPQDAVGRYAAVFEDEHGERKTVDVRLRAPDTGWVRDVVREPTFGYVESPACDVRVGVELRIEVETGERWFAEAFDGVAVRSAFRDAWLVRALKPLGSLEGEWPDERGQAPCDDVDIGFALHLDGGASGGRIVEQLPGVPESDDACFREVLAWELPDRP